MHDAAFTSSLLSKHFILAVFGGLVHALKAYREGTAKGWIDVLILSIISSFSGILFALVALTVAPQQEYLTFAAAGAGGFLGIEGLNLITRKIRDMITK